MEKTLADAQARRAELECLFLSSLPDIERVTRFVARRQRLSTTEAEDFLSEVNLSFIRSDYAVLASFGGRSSLRTYLTTVIQRLFLDYRRKLWGKWRPSAEALRRGPLAIRLEILLYRDGLSLEAALETLRTNFACPESREAITDLAHALPARTNRRAMVEGGEDLALVPAGDLASPETQLEGRDTSARAQEMVAQVMEALDAQDRIVLRMKFEDDISVADIARTLKLDQKRLYRRIEELLAGFRKSLEARGLDWSDVGRMIDRGQCHLCLPALPPESFGSRPSPEEVQA
ncbi:MAG: sigma-70 family RNA polymerase sigma factor [Vicinamibacteria bacterium]|nr:sigma-70 family RNA polymerase sigma factor [Vicinamibacteria bacterium]